MSGAAKYTCPVCGVPLHFPPRDWSICPNCWCEFSGDGDSDAQSGLPIDQYREKFQRGDFDARNLEYARRWLAAELEKQC